MVQKSCVFLDLYSRPPRLAGSFETISACAMSFKSTFHRTQDQIYNVFQPTFTALQKILLSNFVYLEAIPCALILDFHNVYFWFPGNVNRKWPKWGATTRLMVHHSVAVCCSVLQCVAVCQQLATEHSWKQTISASSPVFGFCLGNIQRHKTLQNTAKHCNILQHTATHCNTLQHIQPHLDWI